MEFRKGDKFVDYSGVWTVSEFEDNGLYLKSDKYEEWVSFPSLETLLDKNEMRPVSKLEATVLELKND